MEQLGLFQTIVKAVTERRKQRRIDAGYKAMVNTKMGTPSTVLIQEMANAVSNRGVVFHIQFVDGTRIDIETKEQAQVSRFRNKLRAENPMVELEDVLRDIDSGIVPGRQ